MIVLIITLRVSFSVENAKTKASSFKLIIESKNASVSNSESISILCISSNVLISNIPNICLLIYSSSPLSEYIHIRKSFAFSRHIKLVR